MPDYVRVTDLDTGHKRTVLRSELDHGNYRELKADALNANGDPLEPEFNATKPSTTNEGQTATDTKEK